MGLNKAKGNMYDWVTHVHTHLRGACPHRCGYCYVQHGPGARTGHYAGPLRLAEKELEVRYGRGKVIFLEHCSDLFAEDVPALWVEQVLCHARMYPANSYVLQTKNPARVLEHLKSLPPLVTVGTTLESDLWHAGAMGNASHPQCRLLGLRALGKVGVMTFVTVEPVMRFSTRFARRIDHAQPLWVNVGADSKKCRLLEPTRSELEALVLALKRRGLNVRPKENLRRLMGVKGAAV